MTTLFQIPIKHARLKVHNYEKLLKGAPNFEKRWKACENARLLYPYLFKMNSRANPCTKWRSDRANAERFVYAGSRQKLCSIKSHLNSCMHVLYIQLIRWIGQTHSNWTHCFIWQTSTIPRTSSRFEVTSRSSKNIDTAPTRAGSLGCRGSETPTVELSLGSTSDLLSLVYRKDIHDGHNTYIDSENARSLLFLANFNASKTQRNDCISPVVPERYEQISAFSQQTIKKPMLFTPRMNITGLSTWNLYISSMLSTPRMNITGLSTWNLCISCAFEQQS